MATTFASASCYVAGIHGNDYNRGEPSPVELGGVLRGGNGHFREGSLRHRAQILALSRHWRFHLNRTLLFLPLLPCHSEVKRTLNKPSDEELRDEAGSLRTGRLCSIRHRRHIPARAALLN